MTRSVYVIGSAGAGKSTFMSALIERTDFALEPLADLHSKPNKKAVVTLRGHGMIGPFGEVGVYLGFMRDSFPGTDGLDRATSPTAAEWLRTAELPEVIIGEGLTLATEPFLSALHETTDLLLVHLHVADWIKDLRFHQRGSEQDWGFVKMTTTRAFNLAGKIGKLGARVVTCDTADPQQWEETLEFCKEHLRTPAKSLL